MENTIENKAKFFAQHWGQEVHKVKMSHSFPLCKMGANLYSNKIDEDYLELTPLSQITDDDLVIISNYSTECGTLERIEFNDDGCINIVYSYYDNFYNIEYELPINLKQSDYIRSKGYAVPYLELSVETMIEYGWIKLKTK